MTTIEHLDRWLDANFVARLRPREFNELRNAMLALVNEDEDYWTGHSWWQAYDEVKSRV
jgi:hypothetical protein